MYQYQSQSPTRDLRSEDLFAGIAKHYPIRTHLQFAAYLVLLVSQGFLFFFCFLFERRD